MTKSAPGITLAFLDVSLFLIAGFLISVSPTAHSGAQISRPNFWALALDSLDGLDVRAVSEKGLDATKVTSEVASYRGRRAVRLLNDDSGIGKGNPSGGQSLAIVAGSDFDDGAMEVDLVGLPRKGSPADTRGFVGLAFRVEGHGARFEAFYLRFTNGRAEDQLRRNHAAQYVSEPDFPWFRLREENPGVYESYVDIEPEAWTHVRIDVAGTKARLYVNHAEQPCLMVNDLKLGAARGQVALWDGADTEAYFSNLRVERR
jgi:hypothetical protein